MNRPGPLLVTAQEAVSRLGYKNVDQFRRAVRDGRLPQPFDPSCKQNLWSWPMIENYLVHGPPSARQKRDGVSEMDRRLGISG